MTILPVNPFVEVDESLGDELATLMFVARSQAPPPAGKLSNADWFDYSLDASLAAKLKIVGFEASASGRRRVYVWDYMRWRAVPDESDPTGRRAVRWGCGVRCAVVATDFSVDASTKGLAGLAGVAANVELKGAKAEVFVSVLGVLGDHGAPPPGGPLSVEKFGKIMEYVGAIAKLLNDDQEKALTDPDSPRRSDPQQIAVELLADPDGVQSAWSVGVVWGLRSLAEGWRVGVSLERFPKQHAGPENPRPDAAIRAAYQSVLGDRYEELDPDGSARRDASDRLLNLEIRL